MKGKNITAPVIWNIIWASAVLFAEILVPTDAINAVTCALEMERELVSINENSRAQNRPTMAMRIGIYTGTVIGGSLGSAQRLKYTTVGDAVNTAARLESLDGQLIQMPLVETDCRILIGASTLGFLGQRFRTNYIGDFLLKGKAEKISVYQVAGANHVEPSPKAPDR